MSKSSSSLTSLCLTVYALFAIFCLLSPQPSHCIEWLGLANDRRQLSWNSSSDCARTKSAGLNRDQRLICKRNIDLMSAVVHSSRETVEACQSLFADRRWNCSTVLLAPKYLPDLAGISREQAFVQSLAAASLMHAIAKACSSGQTSKCGCGPDPPDPPPVGNFKWGGCGDDVRFGLVFSKWFADSLQGLSSDSTAAGQKRRNLSRRALYNAHNSAVGRKIISDSLSTHCKCHGVSGSCSVKTCYRALPLGLLPDVGVTLRNRYSVAVHVDHRRAEAEARRAAAAASTARDRNARQRRQRGGRGAAADPSGSQSDGPSSRPAAASLNSMDQFRTLLASKSVKDDDLVYSTISPDYCLPDAALGSVGTKDRVCDKESTGTGGCRSMCCGRGHRTETVQVQHRCDCKYYWCCYVKCKTCTKTVQIHRCR
jgi:wingless-type MMTV integration site family protein 11